MELKVGCCMLHVAWALHACASHAWSVYVLRLSRDGLGSVGDK